MGAATVLAATQKTLLTSVAFVAETSEPSSVLPVLAATTVSYLLSGPESFYGELQPARRRLSTRVAPIRASGFLASWLLRRPLKALSQHSSIL